jgi:hypothetical protein
MAVVQIKSVRMRSLLQRCTAWSRAIGIVNVGAAGSAGAVPVLLALIACCTRGEPPTPSTSPSIAPPEIPLPIPSAAQTTPAPLQTAAPAPPSASTPPSSNDDPSGLPQTHELPGSSTEAFQARVAGLWEAIVRDDPDRGMPFFFPLRAYVQVKDVADPEADWRHRLVLAFRRDIHSIHARLDEAGGPGRLLTLDVPAARVQWVKPGEEWNKIGYFRVFGSKLGYEINGEVHTIEVRSLISWRGQWYVVHLNAVR